MHYLSAQPCRRLAGFCAGSWKGELTLVNGWDKRGNLPSVLICVWTFFFVCGSWFAVATLINSFLFGYSRGKTSDRIKIYNALNSQ